MRVRRAWTARLAVGVGVLVVLVLVLAWALVISERGARWVVGMGERAGVEVEGVGGRLLGPLHLEGIRYRGPDVEVQVDRVSLHWRPRELLRRTLAVDSLDAEGVLIRLPEPDPETLEEPDPALPPELPLISLPLRLDLNAGRVRSVRILSAGGDEIEITEVSLSLEGAGSGLTLRELALHTPELEVRGRAKMETRGLYPLEAELGWVATLPDLPRMEGEGSLGGSVADLRIGHRLVAPESVEMEASMVGLPGTPRWEGRLRAEEADLTPFLPEGPLRRASVTLEGDGVGEQGRFRVEAQGRGPDIEHLSVSAEAGLEDRLVSVRLTDLVGVLTQGRVQAVGSGHYSLENGSGEVELTWTAALPDRPPFRGHARATGSAALIDLVHHLEAPISTELRARVEDPGPDLRWTAEILTPAFALTELDPELPDHRIALSAFGAGDLGRISGEAEFRGWEDVGAEPMVVADLRFAGDLETRSGVLERLVLRPRDGGELSVRGELELRDAAPRFALDGRWEGLILPQPPYRPGVMSREGTFRVQGDPSAWTTEVDGVLEVEGVPALAVALRGQGTEDGYRADTLTVTGEGVRTRAEGEVTWQGPVEWSARLHLDELALEPLGGMAASRLQGEASAQGSIGENGSPVLEFQVPRLTYDDPARTVQARAAGGAVGELFRLDELEVRSGLNQFRARGSLDRQWDLTWSIQAPDLSRGAGLAGSARGEGSLQGPRDRPRVRADLLGQEIELPGLRLDSVDVTAELDLTDREPSRIRARVLGAADEGPELRADLQARGLLRDHVLELEVRSGEGEGGALALAGALTLPNGGRAPDGGSPATGDPALNGLSWEGSLDDASLVFDSLGEWGLEAPVELLGAPDRFRMGLLCLESEEARACGEGAWRADEGGTGRVELEGVPLERFAHLLPQGVRLSGIAELRAEGGVDPLGVPRGRAYASVREGRLRYRTAVGAEEVRDLEVAEAEGVLDDEGRLSARWRILFADAGGVEGALEADPIPGGPDTRIQGHLDAVLHDRGLIAAISDELWNSQGTLEAALRLEGTMGAPRFTGRLAIEDGAVDVPELGIRVEEVRVTARDRGPDEWALDGGARSGRGSVTLDGTLLLPRPQRPGSLQARVDGRDFQAANSGLARVEISPELALVAGDEGINVTGSVLVPRAHITPGDMEGTVAPSPDVVLVGAEEEEPSDPQPGEVLRARVRVVMGDSVLVDGFGVAGRVEGAVTIVEEPGRLTTGQGELRLVDGSYTAARQRLTIERGRLIYSDRPLEDPGLDLRVVRRTPEVLAGMEIRGTAREPEVTIFSDPVMPEAEAMAYLLIGRSVRGAGAGDGDLMERVATSMGLAGGAALLGRIGPSLGLAEARIERGERLSDAALVVGTQFTPRLFVSYGVGIFGGTAAVLRLRYRLTDQWTVRTESGRELGADLLYSVER